MKLEEAEAEVGELKRVLAYVVFACIELSLDHKCLVVFRTKRKRTQTTQIAKLSMEDLEKAVDKIEKESQEKVCSFFCEL